MVPSAGDDTDLEVGPLGVVLDFEVSGTKSEFVGAEPELVRLDSLKGPLVEELNGHQVV